MRPHRRSTWTVGRWHQCAPHLIDACMDPSESTSQTTFWSVQPFLQSSQQRVQVLYNGPPLFPLKIVHLHGGSGPLQYMAAWGHPSPQPKRHLISIGSVVFVQLAIVTDGDCEHIYVWDYCDEA